MNFSSMSSKCWISFSFSTVPYSTHATAHAQSTLLRLPASAMPWMLQGVHVWKGSSKHVSFREQFDAAPAAWKHAPSPPRPLHSTRESPFAQSGMPYMAAMFATASEQHMKAISRVWKLRSAFT